MNRLSNCLDESFRLSREEAAPPDTAKWTLPWERAQGPGPSADLALAEMAVRSIGSKQIDTALQAAKCLEQVSPVS